MPKNFYSYNCFIQNLKKMANKTYPEKITDVEVMLDALTTNKDVLSKKGLDDEFIEKLKTAQRNVVALNNEQKRLKAALKSKTQAITTELDGMMKLYAEAKKRVKLDIPFERWKEFGISDKK